ncbi:BTAD domain-containing putative transcriptional regulator [Saccharothrix obliqua]|uniref:BTAD domain-containing putative transcriptional regulator n=1 Tax=Saccharothrix obliqua TaxID=2861747 RepID=UPI001C5EBCAF|nr:BTAD domain-containing putative transcriptional regulator [Saccharothrix obliqua]MBW4721412.1 AAA family ATPase [Saccharothrix obliqua]
MAGPVIDVAILGEPAVWRDGVPVLLGGGLPRAVFCALALRSGHIMSRAELIQALWGGHPPASASGSLYTYVSTLRRALHKDVLTTSYAGYRLALPPDALDVHRLDLLRERARVLRERDDPGEPAAVEEALALWRGEALAGVPGPFAAAHRSRLAEVRLALLERRAELAVAAGRYDEVVDELTDLVRREPARERLHALLMTALFQAGRQTDALDAYRRARATLAERFGTEPGRELHVLHQEILAGDLAAGERRFPRPVARLAATRPFVGRAGLVAELRRVVDDVRAGRGGSLWIEGLPGSGKSAVLAEALSGAATAGCVVSWAAADEFAQDVPLHAVERCLTGLGTAAHGVTVRPDTPLTVVLERVRQVLRSNAAHPLVLVLDDLQWADPESLSVWHYLRGLSAHHPLLLIAAGRPLPCRQDRHLPRVLTDDAGARDVVLPPLTDAEARGLLALAGVTDEASARAITALAGGYPSCLLAAVSALPEHGPARRWRVVPPPVVAAVSEQFAQLGGATLETLRAMALLGESCTVDEITAATGTPPSGLVDVLAEALIAGVVVEDGDEVRFAYPLLRRVLYESVPSSLRLAMYQQFAT